MNMRETVLTELSLNIDVLIEHYKKHGQESIIEHQKRAILFADALAFQLGFNTPLSTKKEAVEYLPTLGVELGRRLEQADQRKEKVEAN